MNFAMKPISEFEVVPHIFTFLRGVGGLATTVTQSDNFVR